MVDSFIERQIESTVQDAFGEKALSLVRGISKIAAKQGGETSIQNYKLLGKRALIGFGVALVAVQAVTSVVGFVVSRKSEEQRIERIVRRILEEERQQQELEKSNNTW